MIKNEFFLSALVDFVDNAIEAVYSPENIHAMVSFLGSIGIKRLYWIYYGNETYEFFWSTGIKKFAKCIETIKQVRQPIEVAVQAARLNDMEIIALIKPYENGISMVIPEGMPEAAQYGLLQHLGGKLPCMMRFVREHPEMRIKRRMDDIPENIDQIPVNAIRLYKSDDRPTRIKKSNIQIWTSTANCKYKREDIAFDFSEGIAEAPRNFLDFDGNLLAAKSAPVRALTLSGITLTDRYILITTGFEDGEPDFMNSAIDMIAAYGPNGREIPISVGKNYNIWYTPPENCFGCFDGGLGYDDGFGRQTIYLDTPKKTGREGLIAFTKGKNEYLPTALCEAYPEVRNLWLNMVEECLDAGVDGVDFRIENHSTHTDDPFSYGFNNIIVEEYRNRYGKDIMSKDFDLETLSEIRGEYFNAFLQEAKRRIVSRGKKMHTHMNVEFFRPDPPASRALAYPWNIRFDWRKWLDEGIADEVTLRNYQFTPEFILKDTASQEIISECQRRKIPINYNRYIQPCEQYMKDLDTVYTDGRFQSFIVYEAANFIKSDEKRGIIVKKPDLAEAIKNKAVKLGIL